MLGTFSKIVAPGLRLGWIYARQTVMEKLIVAKQASDLHSNYFSQRVICQYLQDNDLGTHLDKIRAAYKTQRDLMVSMLAEHFPRSVHYVNPDGGMFLWLTLPEGMSSMTLFERATALNVAFVPGKAFYVDGGGDNTLRLNYSNANSEKITTGMHNLAEAFAQMNPSEEPLKETVA
jgi:2-aminoadipate transaminase